MIADTLDLSKTTSFWLNFLNIVKEFIVKKSKIKNQEEKVEEVGVQTIEPTEGAFTMASDNGTVSIMVTGTPHGSSEERQRKWVLGLI